MTGTAAEITPVVELDNRVIGAGSPGPLTALLQTAYVDAVTGKDPRHLDWLAPIGCCLVPSINDGSVIVAPGLPSFCYRLLALFSSVGS